MNLPPFEGKFKLKLDLVHYININICYVQVQSENNLNLLNQPLYGEGFDDLNAYALTNKFANISCGPTENNILKSSLADKEKASNVAKIKVVVCFHIHMLLHIYTYCYLGSVRLSTYDQLESL